MDGVLYKYVKIDLEQFAMFEENMKDGSGDLLFHTGTKFHYDKETHIICSEISVLFSKQDTPLMKAVMNSYFEIHPDSIAKLTNSEGHIVFPISTLIQFASLNYGSLRGAVYLKTLNTSLAEYILPPIFFQEIIDKDYVVN